MSLPQNDDQQAQIDPGGFLSNKQYDFVKFLTVIVFPATGTLYFALASIWGLPAAEQVLGTLMAIEIFIGAVMGISNKKYEESGAKYVGDINIKEHPDKTLISLDVKGDPEEILKEKDEATFKVNSE